MRKLGPMIEGSVIFREMNYGKPNCKCTKGESPLYLCIIYKEKGESKTIYVDERSQAKALVRSRTYKKFKELLREYSKVNLGLLKSNKRVGKKG